MKKQITNFLSRMRAFVPSRFLLSVFCFLPFLAFAQFGGGDGSLTNPYQISTVTHLEQLANDVNGGNAYSGNYFILTADIDLNVAPYNSGAGWKPIGEALFPFSGNFNGNVKKISNLFINDAALFGAGLFGYIEEAIIENLGVENVHITARVSIGGVVGELLGNCDIINCSSSGNLSGKGHVGGVAGSVYNSSITNCHTTGSLSGESQIGGMAGSVENNCSITNCYFSGNVSGTSFVGGVAGCLEDNCSITNSHSSGDVSGTDSYVGGVAGSAGTYCSITNCHSTGEVSGTGKYVGGIAGSAYYDSSISNSYATGAISGDHNVGGIAGQLSDNCTIENCAALNPSVKGSSDAGRVAGAFDGDASTLTNNIAFDGILNKAGNTTWSNTGLTAKDGEDMTRETINTDGTLGNRFIPPVWTTQQGSLPGLFGNTLEMPEHLRIPAHITTESLPDGKVGVSYSETLTAKGYTPITWSVISGVLPTGLSLNAATGEISGTPTAKGTFPFTVKATNSAGDDSKGLSIIIKDGAGIVGTLRATSLQVYPNPTTGQLTINNEQLTINNVEIFDVYGRTISQLSTLNSQLSTSINVSELPAGLYFLRIQTETGTVTQKIIKQ